jgi:hypothetical protein
MRMVVTGGVDPAGNLTAGQIADRRAPLVW